MIEKNRFFRQRKKRRRGGSALLLAFVVGLTQLPAGVSAAVEEIPAEPEGILETVSADAEESSDGLLEIPDEAAAASEDAYEPTKVGIHVTPDWENEDITYQVQVTEFSKTRTVDYTSSERVGASQLYLDLDVFTKKASMSASSEKSIGLVLPAGKLDKRFGKYEIVFNGETKEISESSLSSGEFSFTVGKNTDFEEPKLYSYDIELHLSEPTEEQTKAEAIDEKIKAIGNVTYTQSCCDRIRAARKAYDSALESVQELVLQEKLLEEAEAQYQSAASQSVDDLVDAVSKLKSPDNMVYPDDMDAVTQAESLYAELLAGERADVEQKNPQTMRKLTLAVEKLDKLGAEARELAETLAYSLLPESNEVKYPRDAELLGEVQKAYNNLYPSEREDFDDILKQRMTLCGDRMRELQSGVRVSGISVSGEPDTKTLGQGLTWDTAAAALPENAIDPELAFSSDASSVASVDDRGTVTAKELGTANIRVAAAENPEICKVIPVTVTVPTTKITVKDGSIKAGKKLVLSAAASPADADQTHITYSSSNSKVAKVSASGEVTALYPGTAKITATAGDGTGVTGSCTIKVTKPEVKLNYSSVPLQVNKSTAAVAVKSSDPAGEKIVSAVNSKPSVVAVTVKSGKLTIRGVKKGTAAVTVTTTHGGTAKVKITVKKTVSAEKLTLNKKKATLKKGKSVQLEVSQTPVTSTSKVTWKSSNTKVAKVSGSGKVTAKKKGSATITASANGKKATCKVTVK